MRFWVQYHNYDNLGYLPGGYETDEDDLSGLDTVDVKVSGVTTGKKQVLNAIGDVIFLIVGYGGKQKKYLLWSWIIVTDVAPSDDEGKFDAWGRGFVLNPLAVLSGPKFEDFKRSNGNFGLGFQEITKLPFVSQLIKLSKLHARFELADDLAQGLATIPQEIKDWSRLPEGAVRQIVINAFERNSAARRMCLDHHGTTCFICSFDFGRVYGPDADGIIHVHHLRPLSQIGKRYEVDPIKDLVPICPNCHAVIHSKADPYSVSDIKKMLRKK